MNLGDSIREGTRWLLTGNLASRVIEFLFGVALARILVPADFGMLVTIQIFTGVAGYLAGSGMGQALIQAKTVDKRDFQIVFTIQLGICILIYMAFYTIAPWFAIWFDNPLYTDLLRVSALSFLLRPFNSIPRSCLQREMQFKAIALSSVSGLICSGALSINLALNGWGAWSLILGGLLGAVVSMIILTVASPWSPRLRFNRNVAERLGTYGIKLTTNEIIGYFHGQTGNLIISQLLGPGLVGLFNKADSLSRLPAQIIAGSAYQTVFRALSKMQDNLDQSKYIYHRTITLVSTYTLPFYVGLWWLAEPFIEIVYGSKWLPAAKPLEILALTGLFRCIANPSGAIIAAQNRLGYEIRITLESWVILIVSCLTFIQWGIEGVAYAILLSAFYTTLRLIWLTNQCIGSTSKELIIALQPSLCLNTLLFISLSLSHILIANDDLSSLQYFIFMSLIGIGTYVLSFLFLPIPALKGEVLRWKIKLRLAPVD